MTLLRRAAAVASAVALLALTAPAAFGADEAKLAEEILRSSGAKGGLCVHLGATDGRLTAGLAAGGRFLVQGLAADAAGVEKAREHIRGAGLYGRVSIDRCPPGVLPYAGDIVNLLVAEDLPGLLSKGVSVKEIMRVLAPGGVAYLGSLDAGRFPAAALKAKLAEAGVGEFETVRRSGAWAKIVKPRPAGMDDWTHWRHAPDGNTVSQDTLVGIPARLRWIAGPTWARMHVYYKDGSCNRLGDVRAMVSEGGRVFYAHDVAPRGMEGPTRMVLTARDAYSGVMLWERQIESVHPEEQPTKSKWTKYKYYWYRRRSLVAVGGQVYTVLKQNGPLLALDGATGEVARTYGEAGSPEEVVCCGGHLILVEARKEDVGHGYGPVACLDAATGKLLWRNDKVIGRYIAVEGGDVFCETAGELACLDMAGGATKWLKAKPEGAKVLCFPKEGRLFLKGDGANLYAASAKDGSLLWSYPYKDITGPSYSDTDIYWADGLVWVQAGGEKWAMVGVDPATGQEKKRIDFPAEYPKTRGHHRCHPNKATGRYFVLDTHGLDFVDRQTGKVYDIRSFRGNCYFGLLPANGLLYVPPNVCQCGEYYRGLVALAPAAEAGQEEAKDDPAARIEKGPAFGAAAAGAAAAPEDWPTYRHDAGRSGCTGSIVSTELAPLWERKVAGRITAPTAAGGMVFVAAPDEHEVRALDAKTGQPVWSYTAGSCVDTPPTIHAGLAIFGCRDGWVYCLRAADGKLAWRFRAAPQDRRIVAFEQLQSVWPVYGSVLVQNDVAFVAAGRFSELDGGISLYALAPKTGEVLWSERTTDCLSSFLEGKVWEGYPPVAINDVLVGGGSSISMRRTVFDAKTGKPSTSSYSMWARSGMIDEDSWTGRMRWRREGIEAEMLVFDRASTYGILTPSDGMVVVTPGRNEHKLFAKGAAGWTQQVPLRFTALALAGGTLFAAGVPDAADEKDFWASFDGKKGAELWAVSAADGKKLGSLALDAAPVYDGMAAAGGRLYVSTKDGKLRCFGGR